MAAMYLSSDFGLRWGNVVITPSELARYIKGIDIIDGLLRFDAVKFYNVEGEEYIQDQNHVRHNLVDLIERIQSNA